MVRYLHSGGTCLDSRRFCDEPRDEFYLPSGSSSLDCHFPLSITTGIHIWRYMMIIYVRHMPAHVYDHILDTYMIHWRRIICVSSIWSYVWQVYDRRGSKSYVCKSCMSRSYVWIICLHHICVSYMCQYVIIYVHHMRVKHVRSYMCIIYVSCMGRSYSYGITWCRSKYQY